ncbi:hypothetical protein K438DRAFT_582881 [Mycena galopus ATCC 62051]|nr:hypothetical protein K438DRAFT_582881 [Mycena galopus ATCC 62051]
MTRSCQLYTDGHAKIIRIRDRYLNRADCSPFPIVYTMLIRTALLLSSLFLGSALGQIAMYGQCGGDDIVWPDTCADGLACVYENFWYSQCLEADTTTTTADVSSSTGI